MKNTEWNKKQTNEAWERLRARLEKENQTETCYRPPVRIGRIAVIIILCLLSIVTLYYLNNTPTTTYNMTTENTTTGPTLPIVLSDRSIILLEANSSLSYPEKFNEECREVILHGNAMFHVEAKANCPFRIKIGKAEIEVLGTSFYVESKENEFAEAGVQSGKIKVCLTKKNQALQIKKQEKVTLQGNTLHVSNGIDTDRFKLYTQCLHFKDEALSNILQVINRLNEDNIHLETSHDIGQRKLTFTYTNNPPTMLAELISNALGISYQKIGEHIVFTE